MKILGRSFTALLVLTVIGPWQRGHEHGHGHAHEHRGSQDMSQGSLMDINFDQVRICCLRVQGFVVQRTGRIERCDSAACLRKALSLRRQDANCPSEYLCYELLCACVLVRSCVQHLVNIVPTPCDPICYPHFRDASALWRKRRGSNP